MVHLLRCQRVCLFLIDNNLRTGVPAIFHSILEAFVEFHNLHEKADYGYHMEASYLEQWIKVLKEAKRKSNPYLKDISELKNLAEIIQQDEKELDDLKKRGYQPLNIFQRFERAGMENEYRSFYNFLRYLASDIDKNPYLLFDLIKHYGAIMVV